MFFKLFFFILKNKKLNFYYIKSVIIVMSYKCCGKVKTGNKINKKCNNNIKEKELNEREKLIDGKIYYFCKKHINVNSIEDIITEEMEKSNNETIQTIKNEIKVDEIDIREEIQYPFTMPIMCFTCNTVVSRISIFNKLWNIYVDNIEKNMDGIDKQLKNNNIDKSKWENEIKHNWWQKIGGFEEIKDGIKISFEMGDKEWKNIGLENLCCKRMIYTHEEHPLFVYGPSDY